MGKANMSVQEKARQYLYHQKKSSIDSFDKALERAYSIDLQRLFWSITFDTVIQFNGYDYKKIYEFEKFPCNRVIFVHSDMQREAATRGNSRLDMLRFAYQHYDSVAVVSNDILESTSEIAEGKGNLVLARNTFDYRKVLRMSHSPIAFDENTESNRELFEIERFLRSGTIIASIGRFSPEKQHRLLIDAFNSEWKRNPSLKLVIIGGVSRGSLYRETCDYAASLPCADNIVLIKGMSNPYSILAQSDGFILSSSYEGFGLVLLEATALGIPAVSTDVNGPRGFMASHGGTLVENSLQGVQLGIKMLGDRAIAPMDVDFDQYNASAVAEFYSLLKR